MEMSRKYRKQENHCQVVLPVIKVFLCSFFQIECAVFDCLICCKGIIEGSFYTVFVLAGSSQDDRRSRRKTWSTSCDFFLPFSRPRPSTWLTCAKSKLWSKNCPRGLVGWLLLDTMKQG